MTNNSIWTLNFPLRSQGLFLYHQARSTATHRPYPDLHIAVTKSLEENSIQTEENSDRKGSANQGKHGKLLFYLQ